MPGSEALLFQQHVRARSGMGMLFVCSELYLIVTNECSKQSLFFILSVAEEE
jgi:hypothetical protein